MLLETLFSKTENWKCKGSFFLGRLYYIKTGQRINLNCVEDTILFCFKHISKPFTWISVEKVRKLNNVSYTTSSKGDPYKGYYERSNRISRSSMCTHLAKRGRNLLALSGTSTKLREGQPSAAKGWWIRRKAGKSSTETHEQQEDKTYSEWDESEIEKSERHTWRTLKYPIHMSFLC